MALIKPPVLPTWAESGDQVQPSNAEIQVGWPLSNTPPARQRFNWLLNYLMNGIRYFARRGMPDYDAAETYKIGDRIIGDDGKTYRSLQDANTGNTPSSSPLWWERWGFTKAELTAELNNHDYKDSCRVATTANLAALSGLLTVDGVVLVAGDRVLVKNQITGSQNGIYVAAAGAWSRATDFDENAEVTAGALVTVEAGSAQADSLWMLTTDNPITVGVTALVFSQVNGSAVGTPGTYNSVTTDAQGRVVSGQNFARKNVLINGSMAIAQRATSAVASGAAYQPISLDRWGIYFPVGASLTLAQVAAGLAGLAGFRYAAKMQRNAAVTNVGPAQLRYVVETADAVLMQGKQVTLSFYAKAGANYSAASMNLQTIIFTGTGTDESNANMGTWTGVQSTGQPNTLTTSWQRFSQTLTLPANESEIGILFQSTFVGTAGADDSVYITGVQLEEGSVATNFEHRPIQQELMLCQRYYEKSYEDTTNPGTATSLGVCGPGASAPAFTGVLQEGRPFKVPKRAAPTMVIYDTAGTTGKVTMNTGPYTAGGSMTLIYQSKSGFHIGCTDATSKYGFIYHYTADAEL